MNIETIEKVVQNSREALMDGGGDEEAEVILYLYTQLLERNKLLHAALIGQDLPK